MHICLTLRVQEHNCGNRKKTVMKKMIVISLHMQETSKQPSGPFLVKNKSCVTFTLWLFLETLSPGNPFSWNCFSCSLVQILAYCIERLPSGHCANLSQWQFSELNFLS